MRCLVSPGPFRRQFLVVLYRGTSTACPPTTPFEAAASWSTGDPSCRPLPPYLRAVPLSATWGRAGSGLVAPGSNPSRQYLLHIFFFHVTYSGETCSGFYRAPFFQGQDNKKKLFNLIIFFSIFFKIIKLTIKTLKNALHEC